MNRKQVIMADSNKRKIREVNIFSRLLDEFLFLRRFEFETSLSQQATIEALKSMAFRPNRLEGFFFPRRRVVTIQAIDQESHKLDFRSKLGETYTEVHAQGQIHVDSLSGHTIVSGEIRFGRIYLAVLLVGLFFVLTWLLASFTRTSGIPGAFVIFTLGLTYSFYFRQMFIDRRLMLEMMKEKLREDDQSQAASKRLRLPSTQEEHLHSDIEDLTPHQRRAGF